LKEKYQWHIKIHLDSIKLTFNLNIPELEGAKLIIKELLECKQFKMMKVILKGLQDSNYRNDKQFSLYIEI